MIDSHFKLSLPEVLSEAGYCNFYEPAPVFFGFPKPEILACPTQAKG